MKESVRENQKKRTRLALLDAANRLLKQGNQMFTIDEVAKEALVSVATAYRYFPNAESLRLEAPLHVKTNAAVQVFENIPSDDMDARIEALITYHAKLNMDNEKEFRLYLSSVLRETINNPEKNLRGGRRIKFIEEAISPFKDRIALDDYQRIIATLSVMLGIESVIALKDVCKLNNDEILDVWVWSIKKIIGLEFFEQSNK